MAQPENETEDLLLQITKNCGGLLNKLTQNSKKHLNLNLPNQEKRFHLKHLILLDVKDLG